MNPAPEPRAVRHAPARRARAILAALLLLPQATGCYTYAPLWNGSPAAGSEISLGLSDRGRVALAGPLGPGAQRVTGRLVGATDSAYVIRVSEVAYVGGVPSAKWNGEEVSVSKDFVAGMAERRLSKSRSWIATGIVVAALGLATTIVIKGVAGPAPDTKPVGGGPSPQ